MPSILVLITFQKASLLFGLLAILIPIIIHLFNLRRVKKVEFSNTALLKKVKEESSAKRKPVEILILFSRILGIIFLVLTFAQPIYKNKDNDLKLQDEVLIYLDNSQSLSVRGEQNRTGFDNAYNLAQGVVNSYPDGTKFRFVENAYSNSISTEFTRASLTDNLTEIKQVGVGRSFEEILRRKSGQQLSGDIYMISDFQHTQGLDKIREDSTSQYFLVPVQVSDYSNVSIDTVYLRNTFLSGNVTNLLRVRLKRNDKATDQVNIKLYFDDQLSGTAQVSFQDALSVDYDFQIVISEQKLDRIRISIEDQLLTFDNDYFVTINQLDKVRVLEIFNNNSPSYISSLFADNELFQFTRLNANSLDNQVIASSDFIVLNQIPVFSNQLVQNLMAALGEFKTLVIIPTPETDPIELQKIGIVAMQDTREKTDLDVPDYENPFFQGVFEERSDNLEMPFANISFRLINEELSYLTFRNGRSFLAKVNGQGDLFFFSSSFDNGETSFTNHALFVPVLYKLALGSKINLSNLYHYTDSETIFYPIEFQNNGNIYELVSGEERLIPDQRQEEAGLIMEIPKDEILPGHYDLILNDQVVGTLAFNLPRSESNVHPIDFDFLRELERSPNVSILNSDNALNVNQEILAGVNGISLWKYALLIALLFLFVEIILIRYL